MRKLLFALLFVLSLFPAAALVEVEDAQLQVMHLSADAPAVDVYLDGELAIEALPYPQFTGYLGVAPGTRSVAVVPTGEPLSAAVIGPVDLALRPGEDTIVAAVGLIEDGSFGPLVINATEALQAVSIPQGDYPLLLINAYYDPAVPSVDVANGRLILDEGLGFGDYGIYGVEPGIIELNVTASNTGADLAIQQSLALPAYEIRILVSAPDGSAAIGNTRGDILADSLTLLEFLNAQAFTDIGTFNTLLAALEVTGLTDTIGGDDPLRLYAPTDAAFDALPDGALDALLDDPDALRELLLYHVLPGPPVTVSGEGPFVFETLQGADMSITIGEEGFNINGEADRVTGFITTNGLLSIIDAVLTIPE